MKATWFVASALILLTCACGSTALATPTPFPTPDPSVLRFDPFAEQVAYRGEPFLPLDMKGFLYYHGSLLENQSMTWSVSGSEHFNASIENGVLSVVLTDTDWYGTESVVVIACNALEICIQQNIAYSSVDENAADHVRVIYVGNSGFLIMAGDKKVLVDGMYGENPQIASQMYTSGNPPFENIDLILASHMDDDHFDPNQIRAYMLENPNTVFISTTQSTEQLGGLGERVIAMDPALSGGPETVEVDGITVEALYISHGTPPAGMDEHYNNGFLVTIGDLTFLHSGDVDGIQNMLSYDLDEKNIDLAFIVHFYMRSARDRSAFDNGIAATYYFPIHYEYTTPAFNARITRGAFPDAVIFNSVLQSWIMP